jgi:hypothetical protein
MSARLRRNWPVVEIISKRISDSQLLAVLQGLSENQVLVISEIAANTFYGNIPISAESALKLKPYKKVLEYLSSFDHSMLDKKKYILKKKKTLQILIKVVAPSLRILLSNEYEECTEECDSDMGSVSPIDE